MSNVTDTSVSTSSDFEGVYVYPVSVTPSGRPELTSGKVLQSVLVVNGIRRVGLCKFQDFGKVLSEMRNNGVGDLRDMEESVAM